jgi:S-adenosylmethionine:tRNA ribosyltransferase-isomerase
MLTSDFDYELPEASVAQEPLRERDACRLAAVRRSTGSVRHAIFRDLPALLAPGDLLVLNDSKVLPVRLPCRRPSGGAVEAFLLDPLAPGDALPVFLRPAGRVKWGEALVPERAPNAGAFVLTGRREDGIFLLKWEGAVPFETALLERLGVPPLPPYIRRPRLPEEAQTDLDRAYYQTVYAQRQGSVAAPTAGLHFTPELLRKLEALGIPSTRVTLHVGAGTFQPVKCERLEEHRIHEEVCEVPPEAAEAVAECRARGGRVIAVGTTALRTLESCYEGGGFRAGWMRTSLYVLPGYSFKCVDGLITNFHQPRSTLLPLVAAFWERKALLGLYQECLREGYRFLSYGDACLFL